MVIVELNGGLGNQMFQYAAGRSLATQLGVPLKMDTTSLLDRSNTNPDFVFRDYDLSILNLQEEIFATPQEYYEVVGESRIPLSWWARAERLLKKKVFGVNYTERFYKEPHFHYDNSFFTKKSPVYLLGYWQSEKYFKSIETSLRKEFSFKYPLSSHCLALATQIQQTNSICVNVRRGDFVNSKATASLIGFAGLDYLYQSINYIAERIDNPTVFVFSDEPAWCQAHIQLPYPTTFVTHDYAGTKFRDYMQLMTLCKHFAIPNSTFAWWTAWLANSPQKIVVVPFKWFAKEGMSSEDMHPATWVRL